MRVTINNTAYNLTDQNLLGEGGEAKVYSFGNGTEAAKIYHPQVAGPMTTAQKLQKIAAFPRGLPKEVVAPIHQVFGSNGQALGFTMPRLPAAEDVRILSVRSKRGVYRNSHVAELFRTMHRVTGELHAKGVVIGDYNYNNVMFDASMNPYFIDADSMQFGKYHCFVAHELFLAPELYGRDLAQDGGLTDMTDWYSYGVMLFMSLLYVHPYGGQHPNYTTRLRRAEAHCSIMAPDVTIPKAAASWKTLSDDMLHWFSASFDKGVRSAFPRKALDIQWQRCGCGAEHARAACPLCSVAAPVPAQPTKESKGKCRSRVVFSTPGRIAATSLGKGGLQYLYVENGVWRRETSAKVRDCWHVGRDVDCAMMGSVSLCADGLTIVESPNHLRKHTTEHLGSRAMFAANSGALFTIQGEDLFKTSLGGKSRWGSVLGGSTWFDVGEKMGFGFYRFGLVSNFFTFGMDRPGTRTVNGLDNIQGRVLDAACSFDGVDKVFFELATELNGHAVTTGYLVRLDGSVLGKVCMPSSEYEESLGRIGGRIVNGHMILCATDKGIKSWNLNHGSSVLCPGTLFVDTEPFVSSGDKLLLAAPNGSAIYVCSAQKILELSVG